MAMAVAPESCVPLAPWRCWNCHGFLGALPPVPPGTPGFLHCQTCGKRTRLDRRPAPR